MPELIARKALRLVGLFFGILFLCFLIVHSTPGTPADVKSGWDPSRGSSSRDKFIKLYHLDKPLTDRFAVWLHDAAQWDFGESFMDGEPVTQKIGRALPWTLLIQVTSLLAGLLLGIPLGVWTAVRRDHADAKVLDSLGLALLALPNFWIAMMLVWLFGMTWQILPVSGLHTVGLRDASPLREALDTAWHLVLPILVLVGPSAAFVSRYVRASTEKELTMPYVYAARSRGLAESSVLYRHVLKNALLPVITLIGLSIPALLGGSVILESLFAIPGMGRLFFQAVFQRDYPVVMGVLVLGSAMTLLGNVIADACYVMADPRIRRESRRPL